MKIHFEIISERKEKLDPGIKTYCRKEMKLITANHTGKTWIMSRGNFSLTQWSWQSTCPGWWCMGSLSPRGEGHPGTQASTSWWSGWVPADPGPGRSPLSSSPRVTAGQLLHDLEHLPRFRNMEKSALLVLGGDADCIRRKDIGCPLQPLDANPRDDS